MKKQITESDFIGGQGGLTKDEETALAAYFAAKKAKMAKTKDRSVKRQRPQSVS